VSVIRDFAHLFRAPVVPAESQPDQAEDRERRRAEIADTRVFIQTDAYKSYRERLKLRIEESRTDPRHGTEAVALMTMKREGLQEAVQLLDLLVRLAEEKLNDND
jgi:hypothetical protein